MFTCPHGNPVSSETGKSEQRQLVALGSTLLMPEESPGGVPSGGGRNPGSAVTRPSPDGHTGKDGRCQLPSTVQIHQPPGKVLAGSQCSWELCQGLHGGRNPKTTEMWVTCPSKSHTYSFCCLEGAWGPRCTQLHSAESQRHRLGAHPWRWYILSTPGVPGGGDDDRTLLGKEART